MKFKNWTGKDVAPPPVSPILAPTPTIAEKLKKANADLLNYESPPNSRNSRIGFHEEPRIIEYKSDPESPIVRHRNSFLSSHPRPLDPDRPFDKLLKDTSTTEPISTGIKSNNKRRWR